MTHPSPNHGDRRGQRVELVVLHYTGMSDGASARARLCDPLAEVSAHWLVHEDGTVEPLVPEDRRAWHAGAGSWQGRDDVNSRSIGIEIVNSGDAPFPARQMDAVVALVRDVLARHGLGPAAVIAHSDMAPGRKCDPGPRFDWRRLALDGVAVWPEQGQGPGQDADAPLSASLDAIGYPPVDGALRLAAFRLRFRPWADGPEDARDRSAAAALVAGAAAPAPGPAVSQATKSIDGADFGHWMRLWGLVPDGTAIVTAAARLLPVRRDGQALMLKYAASVEERCGFAALQWWHGAGAVPVIAAEGGGVLMPRADPPPDLADMSWHGDDMAAIRILCATAARLHDVPQHGRPDGFPVLRTWFAALEREAAQGGIFARCWAQAQALLDQPEPAVLLHGDLHHGNVLHFGDAGWLAIDPKGIIGPRAFDYAVMFSNPDLIDPARPVALAAFGPRLALMADLAGLPRDTLLRWLLAWSGLSAAWFLEDDPVDRARLHIDLALAERAAAALNN